MFCFAIDDKQSLVELEKVLTRLTETRSNDTYTGVLVATKSDLNHAVSQNEIEQIVSKYNLDGYMVTSSKLDQNVNQAFETCFELAIPKLIPQDLVAKAGRGERIVKKKKKCTIC
jgi:GTPase SAR1 family protein